MEIRSVGQMRKTEKGGTPEMVTRVTFGAKVRWDKEMHGGKAETAYEDNSFEKCV